jgi:low temperature requirement protein LtrA
MVRQWWQPPRLTINIDSDEERKATWLELFYDLVYVVVVAELAAGLNEHVNLDGLLAFVLLFIPVWWSWTGVTFYNDRFDTDNTGHRLLTLLQMVAIVGLAVNVHAGLGETSQGFALAYAANRAVLILMYWRVARAIPQARPLAQHYMAGFSLAALIWLLSVFLPPPLRFVLWTAGLLVDIGTAILPRARRLQQQLAVNVTHLPERFGLFTILVLGETVNAVVHGATEHGMDVPTTITTALGLAIAFSLWWIYFDNLDGSVIRRGSFASYTWIYTHLPLVIGLTAIGVGVERLVSIEHEHLTDPDRWLIGGAVALSLAAMGVLDLATRRQETAQRNRLRAGFRFGGAALALLLGLLGGDIPTETLMVLVALSGIAQVAVDLYIRATADTVGSAAEVPA